MNVTREGTPQKGPLRASYGLLWLLLDVHHVMAHWVVRHGRVAVPEDLSGTKQDDVWRSQTRSQQLECPYDFGLLERAWPCKETKTSLTRMNSARESTKMPCHKAILVAVSLLDPQPETLRHVFCKGGVELSPENSNAQPHSKPNTNRNLEILQVLTQHRQT